jgi:protein involved in polysaccharide export with SLBB domain
MIQQLRKMRGCWVVALSMILAGLLSGCQTEPKPPEPTTTASGFHVGDTITVSFVGQSGGADILPSVTQPINESSNIVLSLIGSVPAAGKTTGELQKEIHDLYVPKYFPDLNVTVKGGSLSFFYVEGEVTQPGQKECLGQMTIVKAISAAGGFTDFANEKKVRLTRGNHTETINVKRAIDDPRYDVEVIGGDKIHVPRRLF